MRSVAGFVDHCAVWRTPPLARNPNASTTGCTQRGGATGGEHELRGRRPRRRPRLPRVRGVIFSSSSSEQACHPRRRQSGQASPADSFASRSARLRAPLGQLRLPRAVFASSTVGAEPPSRRGHQYAPFPDAGTPVGFVRSSVSHRFTHRGVWSHRWIRRQSIGGPTATLTGNLSCAPKFLGWSLGPKSVARPRRSAAQIGTLASVSHPRGARLETP